MLSKERYDKIMSSVTPQGMLLNLTDQCNLRCYYCFVDHAPHYMSFETMIAATEYFLNRCNAAQPISIDLFGGEPMLQYNKLIVPYINWLEDNHIFEKYDLRLGMTTNGTLLDEEKITFLHNHNVGLLLSIDGDEETQNYNRAAADPKIKSFDLIKDKIPNILKYYPEVTFRATITPFSAFRMVDNYLFARNQGFQNMYMMPNSHEEWPENSIDAMCASLLEIARLMVIDIENGQDPLWFSPLMGMCATILTYKGGGSKNETSCGWGTVSFGVGTDGRIFGCQERSSHDDNDIFWIGDIFNGIDEKKHRKLLAPLETGNLQVKSYEGDDCSKCPCNFYCNNGICQSHAEWNTGDLTAHTRIECIWERGLMITAAKLLEYLKDNEVFIEGIKRHIRKE